MSAPGESLEISALPGCESVVRNGVYAGKNLAEMLEIWGGALTGGGAEMPLLLKILDARECLSVQVHPDDEDGRPAKARPGSCCGPRKAQSWFTGWKPADGRWKKLCPRAN